MSLAPGSEKEVDKGVAKFFGAWLPSRDMNADYYYLDEDGVRYAAGKVGNSGATPSGFVDYKAEPMAVYINRNTKLKARSNMKRCISMASNCWDSAEPAVDSVSHLFEGLTEYFTRKMASGPRTSYAAGSRLSDAACLQQMAGFCE